MADEKKLWRLLQVAKNLNVGIASLANFLNSKGHVVQSNPNFQISQEQYNLLQKEFASSVVTKKDASAIHINKHHDDVIIKSDKHDKDKRKDKDDKEIFIKTTTTEVKEPETVKNPQLQGLTVLGKIDLDANKGNNNQSSHNKGGNKDHYNKSHNSQHNKSNDHHNKSNDNKNNQQHNKNQQGGNQHHNKNYQQNPFVDKNKTVENKSNFVKKEDTNVPNVEKIPTVDKIVDDTRKSFTVSEVMSNKKDKQFVHDFKENVDDGIVIEAKADKLQGLTVLGKIELPIDGGKRKNKPVASSDDANRDKKKKRKRIRNNNNTGTTTNNTGTTTNNNSGTNTTNPNNQNRTNTNNTNSGNNQNRNNNSGNNQNRNNNSGGNNQNRSNNNSGGNNQNRNNNSTNNNANSTVKKPTAEVTEKEIQEQIKNTLARLSENKNSQRRLNKREKKVANARKQEALANEQELADSILKVAEFVSTNDLATMMGVSVNEVISKCLSFGMFVAINQRLDAEAITFIADEFGYAVEFTTPDQEAALADAETPDDPKDLEQRAPIVTIMGHVDHGKTSLLDFIRRTKVVEKEAGGITQHIGAYDVKTKDGRRITFLDTPGHEAFTAMRARGAKVTDIAIIVIAADDSVMPQTREAINHAQNAGVKIIFAFNKIDKAGANTEKIRKELAEMNFLVETWGGKYQEQEISAKKGLNIDELLEKVLLEAEMLELTANPKRRASGTVIEATLDKGRGYVTTVLVQTGTLKVGDAILAGSHYGKVKAMTDHTAKRIQFAGPSIPVQIIGFNGAPQAGDKFMVMETEREAREIATKREQILREQSIRTTKRTTLTDLGRRIALGTFKQLNIIIKGDVDGSVEALSDSLLKLSTEEIEVRVIHKGVGQISESDVLLAAASDAIVIGFQVRPSAGAKKLAEQEQIDMRFYAIIYDAINEIKTAMEGMLAPSFEEVIVGNLDIREVFKISKVGTIAGCMVTEGFIKRQSKIRVIREGIVVYGGEGSGGDLTSLKRFKDDVAEVKFGFDCGIGIKNFNDMRVGDTIEVFEQKEVKRKL